MKNMSNPMRQTPRGVPTPAATFTTRSLFDFVTVAFPDGVFVAVSRGC